jgi:hypothetical protein
MTAAVVVEFGRARQMRRLGGLFVVEGAHFAAFDGLGCIYALTINGVYTLIH